MVKVQRTKLTFGRTNLKRHFGLPFAYLTNDIGWWGRWMDHYKLERVTREDKERGGYETYVVLISEPYQIHTEGLQQILDMCRKYNLNVTISGNADHNPGCCRIEITVKEG